MADDPLLAFHADHEAIRPRLRALERALDAAMNRNRTQAAERAVFQETLSFFRTELTEHLAREERALLPALEARVGRFGTLVNVIAYDHDEIRRGIDKFSEALAALRAKASAPHAPELRELNRHGIFLVQYVGLHMAKEDSSLAEMARRELGEEGIREVARRLRETA